MFSFSRNASGSDEKPGLDQSSCEAPSPTDDHSPHEDPNLCDNASLPEGSCMKEVPSPGDSVAGVLKLRQSCGFGDLPSRNGDMGLEREGDKIVAREVSPTRWCAVTAWQRRQQQQQQQGTPGHRSEVSSIVESALDTEDGE